MDRGQPGAVENHCWWDPSHADKYGLMPQDQAESTDVLLNGILAPYDPESEDVQQWPDLSINSGELNSDVGFPHFLAPEDEFISLAQFLHPPEEPRISSTFDQIGDAITISPHDLLGSRDSSVMFDSGPPVVQEHQTTTNSPQCNEAETPMDIPNGILSDNFAPVLIDLDYEMVHMNGVSLFDSEYGGDIVQRDAAPDTKENCYEYIITYYYLGTKNTDHKKGKKGSRRHGLTRIFSCDESGCQRVFKTQKDLRRHCTNVHGDPPKYQCRFSYKTGRKDNFQQHVGKCTKPEKQADFVCFCGYSVTGHQDLCSHIARCSLGRRGRPLKR